MRKTILFSLTALFVAGVVQFGSITGLNSSFAAAPKIVKFATVAPQGSTWANVLNDVDKEIGEKSNGRIRLKVYAGGVSGDDKDVIRKMRIGQIHSSSFTTSGLGEILSEARIFDLPFIFTGYEELDFVRDKFYGEFEKRFEKKGYVLLGMTEVGNVYFFTNSPINTISDLQSVRMWMWEGDRLANTLFNTINIAPIPLSIVSVMSSLQSGLIDGVYASPLGSVALQWYAKAKYMLDMPITNAVAAILIKKKNFDKLPPDLQAILKKSFREQSQRLTQLIRKDNEEAMKIIKSSGIKITTLNEADTTKFKDAGVKTCELLVDKLYSKEFLNNFMSELNAYRAGK